MISLKQIIKTSLAHDGTTFNVISWVYGAVTLNPSRRRAACMRLARDSRFDGSELCMASGCPRRILDAVIDKWRPRTFLDVGCGVGLAMRHVMSQGVECVGLEGSDAAVSVSPVRHLIRLVNLNEPVALGRTFDVVWCCEVAEHIHPRFTNVFLESLTRHGDRVVLSAARPGQGGAGHFNEQPQSYWVAKLGERGFDLDKPFSEHLQSVPDDFAHNVLAFVRRGSTH